MKLMVHFVPLRVGKHYEQILLSIVTPQSTLYPTSLMHVDTFWEGRVGENILYNKLLAGEVVDAEMEITIQ